MNKGRLFIISLCVLMKELFCLIESPPASVPWQIVSGTPSSTSCATLQPGSSMAWETGTAPSGSCTPAKPQCCILSCPWWRAVTVTTSHISSDTSARAARTRKFRSRSGFLFVCFCMDLISSLSLSWWWFTGSVDIPSRWTRRSLCAPSARGVWS